MLDFVQDGLNSTIARYGGNSTADRGITEAWDAIQNTVSGGGSIRSVGVIVWGENVRSVEVTVGEEL